jgi:hypothetical protein
MSPIYAGGLSRSRNSRNKSANTSRNQSASPTKSLTNKSLQNNEEPVVLDEPVATATQPVEAKADDETGFEAKQDEQDLTAEPAASKENDQDKLNSNLKSISEEYFFKK